MNFFGIFKNEAGAFRVRIFRKAEAADEVVEMRVCSLTLDEGGDENDIFCPLRTWTGQLRVCFDLQDDGGDAVDASTAALALMPRHARDLTVEVTDRDTGAVWFRGYVGVGSQRSSLVRGNDPVTVPLVSPLGVASGVYMTDDLYEKTKTATGVTTPGFAPIYVLLKMLCEDLGAGYTITSVCPWPKTFTRGEVNKDVQKGLPPYDPTGGTFLPHWEDLTNGAGISETVVSMEMFRDGGSPTGWVDYATALGMMMRPFGYCLRETGGVVEVTAAGAKEYHNNFPQAFIALPPNPVPTLTTAPSAGAPKVEVTAADFGGSDCFAEYIPGVRTISVKGNLRQFEGWALNVGEFGELLDATEGYYVLSRAHAGINNPVHDRFYYAVWNARCELFSGKSKDRRKVVHSWKPNDRYSDAKDWEPVGGKFYIDYGTAGAAPVRVGSFSPKRVGMDERGYIGSNETDGLIIRPLANCDRTPKTKEDGSLTYPRVCPMKLMTLRLGAVELKGGAFMVQADIDYLHNKNYTPRADANDFAALKIGIGITVGKRTYWTYKSDPDTTKGVWTEPNVIEGYTFLPNIKPEMRDGAHFPGTAQIINTKLEVCDNFKNTTFHGPNGRYFYLEDIIATPPPIELKGEVEITLWLRHDEGYNAEAGKMPPTYERIPDGVFLSNFAVRYFTDRMYNNYAFEYDFKDVCTCAANESGEDYEVGLDFFCAGKEMALFNRIEPFRQYKGGAVNDMHYYIGMIRPWLEHGARIVELELRAGLMWKFMTCRKDAGGRTMVMYEGAWYVVVRRSADFGRGVVRVRLMYARNGVNEQL